MPAQRITRFLAAGIAVSILLAVGFSFFESFPVQAASSQPEAPQVPRYVPVAGVSLNVPALVPIGGNFSFTTTFDNTSAVDTGYGPFIDLYFPVTGVDGDDGIDFVSATYLGQPVTATELTFPASPGCVNHPYAIAAVSGAALQVCGVPGDKLVVLQLPFGSFTPDQPPAVVTVNAALSDLADLSTPLTLRARGGYQYGATPLQDWCCAPFDATILSQPSSNATTWSPSATVTPYVVTVAKTYNGPEDETATGPNYPRRYTVTADIANGQTITSLVLNDILPDNMQFVQVILPTTPAGASCTTPGTTVPGGTVSCTFASVTGGAGATDAAFTFEFYIPLDDTTPAPVINAGTGNDVTSLNNVSASGSWQPIDPRDPLTPFTSDGVGPEHTLTDKSIAIQKGVANVAVGNPYTPGDTLQYTLSFQVSDFFAFQNVVVTDVISDGQQFDASFTPTLLINGNSYTLATAGMNTANYTVAQNFTGAVATPPVFTIDPAANDGGSTITFRVSDEIVTRGQNGRMVGGCVPPAGTGGPVPNCNVGTGGYNDGATTGTIVFRTVIQDQFTDTFPSGDASVDHGDVLDDDVTVDGDLLSVANTNNTTGSAEADTSAASISIAFGVLAKSVYAVNGSTSFSSPVSITPGDTLTYRIRYTLPTSDFETLVITDYMPLPVLYASEVTVFDDVGGFGNPVVIPAAGHANFGPLDTFRALGGDTVACSGGAPVGSPPANADGTPCMSVDPGSNALIFNYGNYDDTSNTDTVIDLLFTATISDDPFADGLFLTNQANASEGTTNAGDQSLDGIIQIILTEPALVFDKSVIASDNPNAAYSPALPSSVTFNNPGTAGARWTGTLNSTVLANEGLNSDVDNIEAGDRVSFALVVENQGSSSKGAFDLDIKDTIPPGFSIPGGGLNLRIAYGDNSSTIAYTRPDNSAAVDTDLFGAGIRLVDPGGPTGGACQVHTLTGGLNVIVITYDLQVNFSVSPDQTIVNVGTLFNYSGSEGGPDFTTDDLVDDAAVTIRAPVLAKALTTTEIVNAVNDATHGVIGELVTYTLTLTVPQGVTPNALISDTLNPELAFVDIDSVTYSSGVSSANTIGTGTTPTNVTVGNVLGGTGNQLEFDFGDITNNDTDNTVDDTIVIVFRAVILNLNANQAGSSRNNQAFLAWGEVVLSNSDAVTVTTGAPVVELNLVKRSTTTIFDSAGDVINYRYKLTNTGNVTLDGPFTVTDDTAAVSCPSTATLAPGASLTCTASYTATGADVTAGLVTNTATAHGSYSAAPVNSNTDALTVTTGSIVRELKLVKVPESTGFSTAGDVLDYRYELTNTGNVSLTSPFVFDNIVGVICPVVSTLNPGATLTCTASYTVNAGNVTAGSVTNTASGEAIDGNSLPPVTTSNVVVLEPVLQVVKSVSNLTNGDSTPPVIGDAGDLIEYSIVISHAPSSNADAFDVTLSDVIPPNIQVSGFTVNDTASLVTAADFTLAGNNLSTSSSFDFAHDAVRTITVTVSGNLDTAVISDQVITNTVDIQWTSLDGALADRSTHNPDSDERTGSATPAFNDYFTSASADLTITDIVPVKSIVSTSEAHTSEGGDGSSGNPRDLAIGEIMRYRLAIDLPEGSSPAFIVTDTLPLGFSYLANGTGAPKLSFLADTDVTEALDLAGADNDALPPTFDIPAAHLSVAGQLVTFDLGNLSNNDSDVNAETVVIEFNVLVNNDANTNNTDLKNNEFSVSINGNAAGTSNTVVARIIEPGIPFSAAANNKTVALSNSPADAADVATYTVTYTNGGLADAFEARVLDTLPATYLDLTVVNPPTFNVACQAPLVTDSSDLAGDIVDVTIDRVRVGCTVTFTYAATLRTAVTPNRTLTNTAALTYTSLPGANGTTVNATGSSTPGATGSATGERDGSGGVNDYSGSDTASFTTRTVARAKTLFDTELNITGNTNTQAAIGEIVTYRLVITVPEGTTPALQVVDTLGANTVLTDACVSGYPAVATPIAASAGVTTSLAGGFADACNDGTLGTNNPVVGTAGGTPGRLVTWSLGTVTNADTNNATSETITIFYQAVVLNVAANQAAVNRTNSAVVSWTSNTLAAATATVGLVEPTVNTAKGVSAGPYDAGDTLTYTVTLTNPAGSTTAFDATLNDPLPAFFSSASVSTVTGGTFTAADFSITGCPGSCLLQTAAVTGIDIPASTTVTITVQATLSATVPAGQTVTNTATTRWTSIDGSAVDRSTYNANSDERDGTGGLLGGGALNDYRTQGAVSFTTATPLLAKQAPSLTVYAIGAPVTYPILVTLPEGVTQSLRVVDQVPAGMLYLGFSVDDSAFAGTVDTTPTVTPGAPVDGDDITFDFGNTTTTADGNAANNSFTLNVTLQVLDVPANQTGATLTNSAVLRYVNPNTGTDAPDVSGGSRDISIAEPRIVTNKSVDITTGVQAGDVLTYTVTFSDTNTPISGVSTAYDVSATDVLAQGIVFTALTSCSLDSPVTDLTGLTTVDTSVSGQVTFSGAAWDVPPSGTITCIYTATAQPGLYTDGTHTNTVDADWSSLDGVDADERIYDDTVVRTVDGTQDTDTASFTSDGLTLSKGSDVTQLAIGATVTFTLTVSGPNGTIRDLVIADQLPAGLVYNNDAIFSGVTAPVSSSVSSPNDGTAPVDLNWDFDDALKSAEPFTIVYSARAADVATNLIGTGLVNAVTLDHDQADGTPATQLTDDVTVTITEPVITFAKSIIALPSPLDAGGVVQYQITYANALAANVSTAFEVHITDSLPAQLSLILPVTVTPGGGAAGVSDASAGNSVDVTVASVPPGGSVTVDYSATIQNTVSPGDIITNTSNADWTSLSGTVAGERDGSDGPAGSPDNYAATDSENFTIASGSVITKQLVATSATHTTGSNVTIGEEVTYGVLLTFPEGTTTSDTVLDDLPSGLALVSGTPEVVTTAAASGGLLGANFNGTLGTQNITEVTGDGGSVRFDFTNVVVAGDNDGSNNTILMRFRARVTDIPANAGFPVATVISNSATNTVGATSTTSNSIDVTVVEPRPALAKSFANVTTPASGASGIVGDVIRMTLTYQNTGTSNAYDIIITDALETARIANLNDATTPAGFVYSDAPSGLNTIIQYVSAPGVAVIPGATVVFEVEFTLTAANVPGETISNTADVTQTTTLDSSINDGDDANERNTTTDASADLQFNGVELAITKDDGGITTSPGSNLSYTLSYNNSGNLDSTNVILTETVPLNTTYDSANNVTAWNCGVSPAPAGATCTFNLGTVAQGTGGSVTFVVTVDTPFPASTNQVSNTAGIDGDQPETVLTDNDDSETTPVSTTPALTVTKTDGLSIVAPGQVLTYTITVTNAGNQDLNDVVLTDDLPAGVDFNSASGVYVEAAGLITWSAFDLAAGDSVIRTVTVTVQDAATLGGITSLDNQTDVTDDGTNTTGFPVTDTGNDIDNIATSNVKTLTGTSEASSANPNTLIGEILDYSIRIDIPVGTINDLQALDILDRGLAFVGCDPVTPVSSGALVLAQNPCTDPGALTVQAEPVTDTNLASVNAGRRVTFDFGQVQNGSGSTQVLILNYQVVVLDIADNVDGVSGLNNIVTWSWEGGTLSGSAAPVDIIEPDLSIDKSALPLVAAYDTPITFTIDIEHTAESTAPAFDVVVTDVLPPGLVYVAGSTVVTGLPVSSSAYNPATATLTFVWDVFPLGESSSVSFQATFIGPSPVTNTASVAWTSLPLDPGQGGLPVQQSDYNIFSTERWYDPLDLAGVDNYGVSASVTIRIPRLPETGFAPGIVTNIPPQPLDRQYNAMGAMVLEIPALQLNMPVVGVPTNTSGWDLTWLANQAGYLEGTTFPGQVGTTGITGHVYLADGTPGPFLHLGDLKYGDQIVMHANGQRYVYEVRTNRVVLPNDLSVLKKDAYTWLTLITCKQYVPSLDRYNYRLAVRAVLVRIEPGP